MTREDERLEQAKNYNSKGFENAHTAFLRGTEWADSTMIEKVCEWLRNNWRKYINIDADGIVCFGHWENDFRKAMKGE